MKWTNRTGWWSMSSVTLGWALVFAFGPAATCPGAAPPPTLPLPATADPPKEREIRAFVSAGGGGDLRRSGLAGGAIRATYSPKPGMIIGAELGVAGSANSTKAAQATDVKADTVVSSRLLVGYAFRLYRRYLSLAGELGMTPGVHSEYGGFVGPDCTLSLTAGGLRWWAITLGYRIAYMVPSREDKASPVLYHLAALTVVVPRRARYGAFLQAGVIYGQLFPPEGRAFGLVGVAGFRFTYGR
ncbi:MAG: hypothetical protein ABI333_03645 [bacterium]